MATIKAQFSLGNNNVRSDKTLDIALREALVNTMVHADYLMPGEYIKIEVYEGWYSFRNPGKMLVSENEYACGGVSKVRNEILMKCFRLLGFAERQGMGGREIVTTAMSLNLRQPDIDTSFSYTNLVFWKTDLVDSHDELSKNEKIVFSYIINNKTASKKEIVNACPSISDRQIRSVLESLQSRNLVKLSGKGPAARYCLHEQSPEKKVQIQKEIYSLLQFIRS